MQSKHGQSDENLSELNNSSICFSVNNIKKALLCSVIIYIKNIVPVMLCYIPVVSSMLEKGDLWRKPFSSVVTLYKCLCTLYLLSWSTDAIKYKIFYSIFIVFYNIFGDRYSRGRWHLNGSEQLTSITHFLYRFTYFFHLWPWLLKAGVLNFSLGDQKSCRVLYFPFCKHTWTNTLDPSWAGSDILGVGQGYRFIRLEFKNLEWAISSYFLEHCIK